MQENWILKGTKKLPVRAAVPSWNNLLDCEDENYEIWALIVSNDLIHPTKCGIRRLMLNFGIKYYIANNF